ncbi:MAG TPA: hypothetical protein EYH50_00195 [Pyrodictium delaneyi]|uniref:Uncharacterized protein n=1 Tax=Pyrodictium delaneyi TaxID=1273541 RepID=A0A833E8R5_9CREN|nr:hypothetical protein [Pyrodictium delaneyi]
MATEAPPNQLRKLFKSRGLKVAETKSQQVTLLGGAVKYHSVSGLKQGSYRITVKLLPEPSSTQLVINAASEEEARRAADKLERLGFNVDTDGEVVRAKTRSTSITLVSKAIDVAEEATKS